MPDETLPADAFDDSPVRSPVPQMRCVWCVYWQRQSRVPELREDYGGCRRYPEHRSVAAWEWCGEWKTWKLADRA